ncbi:hypothetical protein RB653_005801 [Dictyostelium firmibasis]|uniref:WD repeat-containing protein 4 homolog n=1 Tax=Dictyostelium firmibasis TaxID=79012 RepID=A0AAN7ULN1_9MYCE
MSTTAVFIPPQIMVTPNIEKVPISIITHSSDNNFIAFSLNNKLNVFDNKLNKLVELESSSQHTGIIRSIEFSKNNQSLITSSSDKFLKIWDVATNFKNIKSINTNKKIICSILNKDDSGILVSDKCGDVFKFSLVDDSKNKIEVSGDKSAKNDEKESDKNLVFGHYSSIVDIKFSACFNYLLSADRDEKIRVSHYPNCFDIESFCLGHTKYVTEILLVPGRDDLLISGSGDGTIKLWNWKQGKCLQTVDFNGKHENAITIPQVFKVDTNQLIFSIENSNNIYLLPMNIEKGEFNQSELKTISITQSSPISIDLIDNGKTILASLLPTTKEVDIAIAFDSTTLSQDTENKVVIAINSINTSTTFSLGELKSILESIEKKQYRKHVSYSKQMMNSTDNKNKEDDDLSLDEQDIDDSNADSEDKKKKQETAQDSRPLKLRKMTVEGDKEIQKELEEKESKKQE